ncbi:SDR family oxidoreductase [Tropicimonas isoalkanivorans]|uniref:2-hydroxycyclohexanecarboxyl-CoA dehydrogenase n=1 Tax=Tropicimonas isoalkanivorans TaxID=441112 RepID=A0A1I1HU34_9RHOB|nr:SDR family oxidoreductase [Tropicimonas isoalkanivorans]SFC27416.1 2-hydroxycyclohexanecarboxyl-CoA dehydrogenase [Tropicimonas isoalkanivorans]
MRGLKNRVVILTGGSSGIGKATALRLAEEGAKVAIFDLNESGARDAAAEVRDGTIRAYGVDITDRAAVEAAVEQVEADLGPVELLANVAGWDLPAPFVETDRDFWDKVIAINLYGPLIMHHVVLPRMAARGFGRVVNVSSDAGRVGSSGEAVYSACKGGIIAFTKTMAREMARKGITLNTVAPGPTDTPLFDGFKAASDVGEKIAAGLAKAIPLGRLGQPEDYPGTLAFLLSDDAAFLTGQTISVSGGLTMHG